VNLRGGVALITRSWLSYLASRGFFWVLALGHLMPTLIYMFVWLTAVGQKNINGFDRDGLIVYYLAMMVLHELTYAAAEYDIGWAIRSGGFTTWLLRPLPPIYESLSSNFAGKVVGLPFTLLAAFLLGLILQPKANFTFASFLLFILALVLAFMLRFLMDYVLSLLAFWSQRSDALLRLSDTLLFLFAGQVAPFALLPSRFQVVAFILPYRYMLGFPVEVLLGRLSPLQVRQGFLVLMVWILFFSLLHQLVWKRGLRHYTAVGG